MDVEHRHASRMGLGSPLGVVQGKHLHTAAAITLGPVAGTADDEHGGGIARAVSHHVHGKVFTVTPLQRVLVGFNRQTGNGCRL